MRCLNESDWPLVAKLHGDYQSIAIKNTGSELEEQDARKAKYGGLDVSDARRLKTLEDENARLKKLLAEAMLDNAILKDVASKKW